MKVNVFIRGNGKNKDEIKEFVENATYNELESQSKTLFNRVNKRIRTLESHKKDVISPSYNALVKSRGTTPRFGTKGSYTDKKSLQKEIAQALSFDTSETGNYKGAKAYTKNLKDMLPLDRLDDDKVSMIFDTLHSVHERMPDILYSGLLQYSDYLDTVVETAEDLELDNIDDYESQLESMVEQVINQLTDKLDEGENLLLSSDFDRLF